MNLETASYLHGTIAVLFCLQSYIHIHSSFGTNFVTGQARELHLCER